MGILVKFIYKKSKDIGNTFSTKFVKSLEKFWQFSENFRQVVGIFTPCTQVRFTDQSLLKVYHEIQAFRPKAQFSQAWAIYTARPRESFSQNYVRAYLINHQF